MKPAPVNRTIRITAAVAGTTLAIAGLHHGFFEVLQGNQPTPGFGIHSIGADHVRWAYGTDDAITVIPNFLATGLAAMTVSVGVIAWSIFGLHRSRGPSVFLALFVLLTLVGGGMGHIPFFVTAWAWATMVRGPLPGWGRALGAGVRRLLARAWLPALVASSLLFLLGLELSVFGYPPLAADPDRLLVTIWSILGASLVAMNVAFLSAVARDPVGPVPSRPHTSSTASTT